jgi:hypothetical protein
MRERSVASLAANATIANGSASSAARARNRSRCQRLRNVPSTIAMPPAAAIASASSSARR